MFAKRGIAFHRNHDAVGGVLKKGRDLTYLLRWTAKPGAVMGDPIICKMNCVRSLINKHIVCTDATFETNLAGILAHMLDVNAAKE